MKQEGTAYRRSKASEAGRASRTVLDGVREAPTHPIMIEKPHEMAKEPDPLETKPLETEDINLNDGGCWVVIEWHKDARKGVKDIHMIGGELTYTMATKGLAYANFRLGAFETAQIQELMQQLVEAQGMIEMLRNAAGGSNGKVAHIGDA